MFSEAMERPVAWDVLSVLCPVTYIWMSQNTNVTLSKKTHELWLKKWRFLGSLAYEFLRLYIQKALLPSGNACF